MKDPAELQADLIRLAGHLDRVRTAGEAFDFRAARSIAVDLLRAVAAAEPDPKSRATTRAAIAALIGNPPWPAPGD